MVGFDKMMRGGVRENVVKCMLDLEAKRNRVGVARKEDNQIEKEFGGNYQRKKLDLKTGQRLTCVGGTEMYVRKTIEIKAIGKYYVENEILKREKRGEKERGVR